MKRFTNFLQWLDNLAPDPWIVDGHIQIRPSGQLGFLIGIIIGLIICLIFI